MVRKTERHAAILQLIRAHDVASQEELRKLLQQRGVSVTQATLSRDLRELGVVRVPGDEGARYAMPDTVVSDAIPSLETLLPQLFSSIDGVGELIVLRTLASGAQPVSEAIDAVEWREVLGSKCRLRSSAGALSPRAHQGLPSVARVSPLAVFRMYLVDDHPGCDGSDNDQ